MLIGPVACTVESNYTGTMIRKESLNSPWKSIYPTPSTNYNTHTPKDPNIHHTNGNTQTMDQKYNGPKKKVN